MAAAQICVRLKGSDICPFHPGNKVVLECEDCHGTLVCQLCTTTLHKRHGFREIKIAVRERTDKIVVSIQKAKQETRPLLIQHTKVTIEKLHKNKEEYQRAIEQVKQHGETVKMETDLKTTKEVSRLEFLLKENNDMLAMHQTKIEQLQRQLDKDITQLEETLKIGTDYLVYDTGAEVDKRTLSITIPVMPTVTTSTFTPCKDIKHHITKAFGEIQEFTTTQTSVTPQTDIALTTSSSQAASLPTLTFSNQPTTLYERKTSYTLQYNCICPWIYNMAWTSGSGDNKLHLVDIKGEEQRTLELDMNISIVYVHPTTKEVYISCYEDNSVRTVNANLTEKKIKTKLLFHTSDTPGDIACVGEDKMVVSTYDKDHVNVRVCLFTMKGKLLNSYVYKGKGVPAISVCQRTNIIAVLGGEDGVVAVLNESLKEVYTYRGEGSDRNKHKHCAFGTGVFVDTFLLLGDALNSMIHILTTKTGRCIKTVRSDSFFQVVALGVQRNGDLWVGSVNPDKLLCVKYLE